MLVAFPKKLLFNINYYPSMILVFFESYYFIGHAWLNKACFSYLESCSDVGDDLSFKSSDEHGGKLAGNKLFGLSLSIWFPLNDSSTKLSQQWSFRASRESSVIWLQPITSSDLILC